MVEDCLLFNSIWPCLFNLVQISQWAKKQGWRGWKRVIRKLWYFVEHEIKHLIYTLNVNFVIYGWCTNVSAFQKSNTLKVIDQLDKEEKVQNIVMYLRQGWEGGVFFSYIGSTSQRIFLRWFFNINRIILVQSNKFKQTCKIYKLVSSQY